MKRTILLVLLFLGSTPNTHSQTAQNLTPTHAQLQHLLGKTTIEQLRAEPFSEWFTKNYNEYEPNMQVVKRFAEADVKKLLPTLQITVVYGTWCGDSKREVPRFLKLAEQLGLKPQQITLIGVDNTDSSYKQSPNHEERAFNVFRVPTFIITQNGREIERITEFPVTTLERDLYSVVKREPYVTNYPSYKLIQEWLSNGVLADTNTSATGIGMALKRINPALGESELNACGYVLMSRGQITEALAVFRANCVLFPLSANCWESLSECYEKKHVFAKAIQCCERALELDPKNAPALKRLVTLKAMSLKN